MTATPPRVVATTSATLSGQPMCDPQPATGSAVAPVEPTVDRLLEYVLGIHEHERRTYRALREAPGSTTSELADDLARDRSTVSRSLSTLTRRGLIERERKILEGGGYVYQYFTRSPVARKRILHASVDEWARRAHDRIEAVDD